jgi:hypothetical protein
MCANGLSYLILCDLISLIVFGEACKLYEAPHYAVFSSRDGTL